MTTESRIHPSIRKLARGWLYDNAEAILDVLPCGVCAVADQPCGCPMPEDWIEAVAEEFDAAIYDRQAEILETLAEGRPFTDAVVEWEARDLKPDVAEMLAEQGRRHRALGEQLLSQDEARELAQEFRP